VLLAGTAAGGGYYISSLNGNINDLQGQINDLGVQAGDLESELKADLVTATGELTNKLDETAGKLAEADNGLESKIKSNTEDISSNTAQLSRYQSLSDARFTTLEDESKLHDNNISELTATSNIFDLMLDASVLQTQELYDRVKPSVVRITDGEYLSGSGFLVDRYNESVPDSNIYIVTAYHVIDGLNKIYVTIYDGRSWQAELQSECRDSDIAILSLKATPGESLPDRNTLTSVKLADSSEVKPGDPIFVIGSPGDEAASIYGLRETVNTGVISQVGRAVTIGETIIPNLIQYDAASNFGNSGGPLFNREGKVIGVAIARINPLFGDGIAFAAPSNTIIETYNIITLHEPGTTVYYYACSGIIVRDITPEEMVQHKNSITGVYVTEITSLSNADDLRVGDIITQIGEYTHDDQIQINDSDNFYTIIAEHFKQGYVVSLTVIRGEETLVIQIILTSTVSLYDPQHGTLR